ncbi:hypothetical protein [Serratia marcescens]|uniref:hypothetical protein n=1 Tax=Serratia marcescens TaxID=615 RepID=UPI0034E1BDCA
MMKTNEIITIMDYISKIMSYYPNKGVDFALDDILFLLEQKKNKNSHEETKRKNKVISVDSAFSDSISQVSASKVAKELLNNIENKDIHEIEAVLNNDEIFPNVFSIKIFASHLGLKPTARQSKALLIKTILKAIERSRIDKTIGNRLL